MIGTYEFVRRLNHGRHWALQAEGSEATGLYRFLPPQQNASGYVDGYFDHQNPCLTIRNLHAKNDFYDDEIGLGRLAFVLHLSGSRRIELGSEHHHELTSPTLVVLYQPRGLTKRSVWRRGANEVALSVGVWPEMLTSLFGFYPLCLPDFSEAGDDKAEAFWYSRPLPHSMMSAAEQLLKPGIHPLLKKSYISIKSRELLSLGLSTLLSDGEFLSRPDRALNRIEHLKTMVDANLKNPPLLEELAATLGVSAEDLSDEVRKEMGVSYFQYITERRMNRAMMLLEGNGGLLKQVAYEVGYSHASNFCTAFKRHFGVTPKDARGL